MHSKVLILAAVLLSISLLPAVGQSDASDGAPLEGVLIQEVNPYGASEGVSIFNYGTSPVDLKGYSVTNGKGTVAFTSAHSLPAGARVTLVAESSDEDFASRDAVMAFSDPGLTVSNSLALSNSGASVFLYNGSALVDAVCYGSAKADAGWSGEAVKVPTGRYMLRMGAADTDTAADWRSVEFGWTNLFFDPSVKYDAMVTPFTFPESYGAPLLQALHGAKSTVDICIYELPSRSVAALLIDLEKRTGADHVDVRVLLEASPFGYDTSSELALMAALEEAGGDVRLIDGEGSADRYSYVHAKYAVVDGSRTILTTENWTASNMGDTGKANRGWGVIVDSPGYADYMGAVFSNDWSTEHGDVSEIPSSVVPYSGELKFSVPSGEYASYAAKVTPVLSPDSSYDGQRHYVSQAADRVYVEQLDLSGSYVSSTISPGSPVDWLSDAANRGVDTRFILDASQDDDRAAALALINGTTNVKMCTIDGYKASGTEESFGTTHNKGLIIDDAVWVGSVNWTPNSFENNRESAVYIESAEVADYFLRYFMDDWNRNYVETSPTMLAVTVDSATVAGSPVTFTVNNMTSGSFTWDVRGDGSLSKTTTAPSLTVDGLSPGTYLLKVTDSASGLSGEVGYTVAEASPASQAPSAQADRLTLVEIAGVIVLILAAAMGVTRGSKRKAKRR